MCSSCSGLNEFSRTAATKLQPQLLNFPVEADFLQFYWTILTPFSRWSHLSCQNVFVPKGQMRRRLMSSYMSCLTGELLLIYDCVEADQ